MKAGLIFVVAGGQPAELFQAVGPGRDHHLRANGFDVHDDGICVIPLVGQHDGGLVLPQQGDGLGTVVNVAGRQAELQRLAPLVREQMNLGRQTASGAPQSLVGAPFLRSRTSAAKTHSQTPLRAQRTKRLCTLLYLP